MRAFLFIRDPKIALSAFTPCLCGEGGLEAPHDELEERNFLTSVPRGNANRVFCAGNQLTWYPEVAALFQRNPHHLSLRVAQTPQYFHPCLLFSFVWVLHDYPAHV